MVKLSCKAAFTGFSFLWAAFFMISSVLFECRESGGCDNLYLITYNFFEQFIIFGEVSALLISLLANSIIYGFLSMLLLGLMNWMVRRLEYKQERYRIFF